MKNKISWKISAGLISLGLIGFSVLATGEVSETEVIKERLMSLGFLENIIDEQKDGGYTIKVNAYVQKSQALQLDGVFQRFDVRARYSRGILYLEKTDIEMAGFSVDEEYLPRGVKIIRMRVAAISIQKRKPLVGPYIQRIKKALDDTKRNSSYVFANLREVVSKASNSKSMAAFPDVALTPPSPPAGPIPIPYPNFAQAGDAAKGSKKTKADKAAAIAKASKYRKSESDEVATRMTGLQKKIQKIIASRNLTEKEKISFNKEIETYKKRAEFIAKTIDSYLEEIEKLLEQAKKQ